MVFKKRKKKDPDAAAADALHWTQKTLEQMTQRDWFLILIKN